MIVMPILVNAFIMAAELAAVAAVAALGYRYPFIFAGATAGLSFLVGLRLEVQRLRYELPFYFAGTLKSRAIFTGIVGSVEAVFKGVLAGVAALFTFSGTDHDRLFWVAVIFAICIYAGASVLRYLSIKVDALPMRWGYFRLAAMLGLLFSAGLALLTLLGMLATPTVADIGWKIIFDMPPRPTVEQASELLFQIKQAFDDFIVTSLSVFMNRDVARLIGIVISVNVLSGFVSALYASLISTGVRRAEDALL